MYTINNSGVRGFCSTMGVFMVFDQWWTRKHIYISSLQACYLFYMYGWNVAGQTQALNQYVRLDLGSPIKQNVQLTRIRNTHTNKQTPNQPTKQPYIKHEWSPQSSQGEQSVLRRQWNLANISTNTSVFFVHLISARRVHVKSILSVWWQVFAWCKSLQRLHGAKNWSDLRVLCCITALTVNLS